MRILVIADEESPSLWEHLDEKRLNEVDVILSCGDLDSHYLTFLATFFHGPVVYVPGNHDTRYQEKPPEGCINADGRIVVCGGMRILGLGGCMRYKDGDYQYTERQMRRRVYFLARQLWFRKGFDILLTHAPAKDCGDGPDQAHLGFQVFNELMDRYHPRLMAHGHVHQRYDHAFRRERTHGETRVVNGCGWYIVDL